MLLYEKKISLRVTDYDRYDMIKPQAVLDLFQFAATEHAERIGIGFDDMLKKNLIWVLVRCRYEVVKEPPYCGDVTIRTWPRPEGRIDYDREYEIEDAESGELLVKGSSKWCVINCGTRRISLGGEVRYEDRDFYDKKVFAEDLKKIKDFPTDGFSEYAGRTEFSDLDHNGHVNNARYGEYILNAVGSNGKSVKTFEIDFLNEMRAGADFNVYYKDDGDACIVKGVSDGKENFRARIRR